jgi:replicative DNA helicase
MSDSRDMERMLIGALVTDRDAIVAVAGDVSPEDFDDPSARSAYEAALRCWARQEPPDLGSLHDEMGGAPEALVYLVDAMTATTSSGFGLHAPTYARRIRRAANRRRFYDAYAAQVQRLEADPDLDPLDAVAALTEALSASEGDGPRSFADLVPDVAMRVEDETEDPMLRRVIPTGYGSIDRTLNGGLRPQEVSYWAARTSHGKTSLAADIMHKAARHTRVLFFSLEMHTGQFIRRTLARESGVSMDVIQNARFNDAQWQKFADAVDPLTETNIWLDDTPGITTDRMLARTQRLSRDQHVDLVVIDYLELIGDGDDGKQPEMTRIARIVKKLGILSRTCDCHVMVLCQVSRDVETRGSKMPLLRDLTWSRMIEQNADQIFMLNVHDRNVEMGLEDPDPDKKGITDVMMAKHRNGKLGRFELRQDPATFRYFDVAVDDREPAYDYQN